MNNQSEVALIRAWIDQEMEALQRLREFAVVTPHETIMAHYRVLDVCYQGLAAHVGEEEATNILCTKAGEIQ